MHEISENTFNLLKETWQTYLINILGLQPEKPAETEKLDGVLQLLIDIRKEAKGKKDYATSDKIRNQLLTIGIQLKDEKDGTVSYAIE
jgi:cysteinyl-tRNA synthetase